MPAIFLALLLFVAAAETSQKQLTNYLLTLPDISANITIYDPGEVAEWSKAADC
ncbi:MAG: hypothetical protein RMY62_003100 [Nostoc sp. ZfuVER08]|nr:hypothetical protein [Nostoc sp. ZfuVER08]